jgi:hypothetical protein
MMLTGPRLPTPGRSALGATLAFGLGLVALLGACNELARRWRIDLIAPKYQALFAAGPRYRHVLFGTSHTFYGVNPADLERRGHAVFNFGFERSNPTFYRAFYADLKAYHATPEAVYFGVDAPFLKRTRDSHRYAQDSEYWPWPVFWDHLGQVDGGARAALANRFPLITQRESLQYKVTGTTFRFHYLPERAYRGYVPIAPEPVAPGLQLIDQPDDPGFSADFLALLGTLQADRVRVVMFQTPVFGTFTGAYAAENQQLRTTARAFGFPFLDYNGALRSALNQDPTLFDGVGHLNVRGAERFSPMLARDLDALGAL